MGRSDRRDGGLVARADGKEGSRLSERRTAAFAAFLERLNAAVAPLAPDAQVLSDFLGTFRHRVVEKGHHLLRAGDIVNELFFVHEGLLRYYFQDPAAQGTERTGQFFEEGSIVTEVASFLTREPATQSFEALEETSILVISRSATEAAFLRDHALERFGRIIIESALLGAQRRSASLLRLDPDERYRAFVEKRPGLARRVPQYLIASFLGVTPESLSRVRRRIAQRPGKS